MRPFAILSVVNHQVMTKFLTNFLKIYIKKPLMFCWLFIIRFGQKVNYRMIGMHHAIILPHLKPNKNAANPDSYRPISLTSTMCKVMERLVTNRLQCFVEKNNLLSNNQSGFSKNRSTVDQIFKLHDNILKK